MGTKKNARQRNRAPWEQVVIRMRRGGNLHIQCPRCKNRTTIRYWDPAANQGICWSCVPLGIRAQIPSQPPSAPDHRPMAMKP